MLLVRDDFNSLYEVMEALRLNRKEIIMMMFLGVVTVACLALIAYIMTTAVTIGFVEILGIAIFGFVAAISMLMFATFCMAKYTGHKVKTGVKNFKGRVKRLKN